MLSDLYPTGRRAFALSLIATASPLGMMVAFIVGGWLNDAVGWRMTLVCAGVPGLVLALVVWLTVREPERGASEERAADTTHYGFGVTLRYLLRSRAFVWLTLGAALANFAIMAVIVWSSSFLVRVHGMPTATAGLWLGVATGLGGMAGGRSAGWLASRLSRRDVSWLLRLPALTSVLAAPFIALFLSLPPTTALPSFYVAAVFCGAVLGPVTTAAQEVAKVRMRATAAALLILTLNFIGTGLGPVAVGAVSDLLASDARRLIDSRGHVARSRCDLGRRRLLPHRVASSARGYRSIRPKRRLSPTRCAAPRSPPMACRRARRRGNGGSGGRRRAPPRAGRVACGTP